MPYSIEEHKHRLAAWDAATSASSSPLCRFKVELGAGILEASGFNAQLVDPEQLPLPANIDEEHRKWRNKVIAEAGNREVTFTHGIAAKLINCYLKARFICAGHHEHERVKCLHPPIDAVLLKGLADQNIGGYCQEWLRLLNTRWSKFNSDQYEEVIALVRRSIPGRPLWEIEQYWSGYQ
jgi:hypothetical protein